MDGGGPKPQLCALWGTWSNVNTIIDQVRSIPEQREVAEGIGTAKALCWRDCFDKTTHHIIFVVFLVAGWALAKGTAWAGCRTIHQRHYFLSLAQTAVSVDGHQNVHHNTKTPQNIGWVGITWVLAE